MLTPPGQRQPKVNGRGMDCSGILAEGDPLDKQHPDFDKVSQSSLPFDPVKLKGKYLSDRDKRIQHGGGINQYCLVETKGIFSHYLNDPWVKPGFTIDPVSEQVDAVIVGGGYGAQLMAVGLIEGGVKDIRLIEKKLLAKGTMDPLIEPEKAAAERQLADFEKMEQIRARVDEVVKYKATAEGLKPWNNQLCKRPCFHDGYLQAFNQDNVHLVNTNGLGVKSNTEKDIIYQGKEYGVDCIIYATGFELATE